MIPNNYNPETIHVVNWYLVNQKERFAELFQAAHLLARERFDRKADAYIRDCRDAAANQDEFETHVRETRHEFLVDELGTVIWQDIAEHHCAYAPGESEYLWEDGGIMGRDESGLQSTGEPSHTLFAPILTEFFERVNFNHVAELLLEHAPAVKVA